MLRSAALLLIGAVLSGCSSVPDFKPSIFSRSERAAQQHPVDPDQPQMPAANSGRGGYYKDDGPGDNPPPNLKDVPDAEVKAEPYSKRSNRPYVVFGKTYTPITDDRPYTERGIATWYGRKFHGQKTSSGELYDMYKMTAAHPTLPIPSYARVTSLDNGRSVVVRINDRGPFHAGRVIDVSYTAAVKLGLLGKGTHKVEVERLLPGQPLRQVSAPVEASAEIKHLMLEEVVPGFYLQLGAFSRDGAANEAMEKLREESGLSCSFDVAQVGKLWRVYCGPFDSRQAAVEEAAQLSPDLKLKPIPVKR